MNDPTDISILDDAEAADPIEEELTAYLDGELDADGRAAVERRLAEDEAYRVRMQRMEEAWAMLDALPRTEADATFTQSTVEMVALAAQDEVAGVETAQRRRARLGWTAGVAGILYAGLLGYLLVDRVTSSRNEQLLRDLPVIENVEVYRHIDDVEFLRRLEAEGLFDESVKSAEVDDAV